MQILASIQSRTSLVKFARSPRTDPPGVSYGNDLENLFDCDETTQWNGPCNYPGWMELTWVKPILISSVRLQISQPPFGGALTTHELMCDGQTVRVWSGWTENYQWLEHEFDEPQSCTVMRVVTTNTPSCLAWREWLVMAQSDTCTSECTPEEYTLESIVASFPGNWGKPGDCILSSSAETADCGYYNLDFYTKAWLFFPATVIFISMRVFFSLLFISNAADYGQTLRNFVEITQKFAGHLRKSIGEKSEVDVSRSVWQKEAPPCHGGKPPGFEATCPAWFQP